MKGLTDRVAVVTGAASGIGQAIARRFVEEGVRVIAVDRNEQALAAAGTFQATLAVDVSEPSAPEKISALVQDCAGQCDILVNAAGISAFGLFDDPDQKLWDDTLKVNLDAVAKITRVLLSLLRASDQGRIIMIGSTCSRFASAGLSAYVVSKHAILGLTRALASELGKDGITVNCIQPGAILTGITGPVFEQDPSFQEYWSNKAALGRIGTPEDIAPVAAFLASEEARFMSGHGIYVDGGAMQQN
ncbi:SDR family oxidoreductase [Emcibacter sp.]|uniref:SDR family NAD(P)-dependent oxidoreductase n=1 Tax=Emcibacter sp. TaxID=1979954 RepID=UPI002AA8FB73|nr:SDR family oxidoreductase [Emcibacter sp.]